jgi:hypothetical protein
MAYSEVTEQAGVAKKQAATVDAELVKRMAILAGALMNSGVRDAEIHAKLVEQGMRPETAGTLIRTLRKVALEKLRKRVNRDRLIGGALLLIGTVITLILQAGVFIDPTGYVLLVTWLAMIIGGVLLGRGIMDQQRIKRVSEGK